MSFTYKHGDRPLDGYTVFRGLGRGGFGEVYFAMSDGGREVALKIIQQHHDIELRGVRQCMNLKSPHLVSIFDVKRNDDGVPFVIMEYVTGPSLRDILRQHPNGLGDDRATYMLHEISKGLGYLHERGIVHRDLKPENIFYEDGYVKIGDYGLSKYISVSRQSGQTMSVGTVHYMAPEIGSGNYHRGIDIYALGVIYYELLTGNVPFDGDSMGEIIMKHLTANPDLSGIQAGLQRPLSKALAKTPDERYGRVEPLIADLFSNVNLKSSVDNIDTTSFVTCATKASTRTTGPVEIEEPTPVVHNAETIQIGAKRQPYSDAEDSAGHEPLSSAPSEPPARSPAPPMEAGLRPLLTTSRFGGTDLDGRLVQGAATAVGMAVALSFFSHFTDGFNPIALVGCLVAIISGAAMVLVIEHWAVPRFNIDMGIAKRVMTLGLAGPALAFAVRLFPPLNTHLDSLPAIFASLILINWTERARPNRNDPASLGLAFSAGLCGALATWILDGTDGIFVAGLMASISLVVNAASPFVSKKRRSRSAEEHGWLEQPSSPPPPPPQPRAPSRDVHTANVTAKNNALTGVPVAELEITPNLMYRPRSDCLVAGVCAGIARRYGWEPVWMRLAFVLGLLLSSGLLLPLYLICYLSMPEEVDLRRRLAAGEPLGPIMRSKRLVRSHDRVIGGVCAGLAARYGWEVAWVRIMTATLIFLSVGYGLIPYVILWLLMPPSTVERATESVVRRTPWVSSIFAVLFLGAAVLGFSVVIGQEAGLIPPGYIHDENIIVILLASLASVGSAGFALFRARLQTSLGWWFGTIGPLLLVASSTTATSSLAILMIHQGLRKPDTVFAGITLASSALVSAFLSSHLLAASRQRREGGPLSLSTESQAGWSALGTLLVVTGFAIAVGVAVLTTPFGQQLVEETWQFQVPQTLLRETYYGHHLIPAVCLFAPGMLCLLLARRTGGASHVLRGAIGWSILGFLAGWLALQLPQASWYEFESLPRIRWGNSGVALLAGAILIAWPGRRPPVTAQEV